MTLTTNTPVRIIDTKQEGYVYEHYPHSDLYCIHTKKGWKGTCIGFFTEMELEVMKEV